MSTAIAIREEHESAVPAVQVSLGVDDVLSRVALVQQVMNKVMKDGEHYGAIPGTNKNKKSLLKPGAETLALTFNMAPKYKIERYELPNGHREYEVVCELYHKVTGDFLGSGVGECNTMESKYRYRNAQRRCPVCGESAIIKGKQEYGGGWLCYKNKGGCGAKWPDGAAEIENQKAGKVEHDNPADHYNTVKKMAKKRAHVDATLTAVAASDIFTQDIEDLKANGVIDAEFTEHPPRNQTQSGPGPKSDFPPNQSGPGPDSPPPKQQRNSQPQNKGKGGDFQAPDGLIRHLKTKADKLMGEGNGIRAVDALIQAEGGLGLNRGNELIKKLGNGDLTDLEAAVGGGNGSPQGPIDDDDLPF